MLAIWVLWTLEASVFSVQYRHGDEGLTAELFLLMILFWVERLTRHQGSNSALGMSEEVLATVLIYMLSPILRLNCF